jgi:hypothetical protein
MGEQSLFAESTPKPAYSSFNEEGKKGREISMR